MQKDLDGLDVGARPFARYLTLNHLYNDKVSADVLDGEVRAMSKALNSVSTAPKIAQPLSVDPAHVIFRVDLRDYGWTAATWDSVLGSDPYAVVFTDPAALKLYQSTTSKLPFMRGDGLPSL